MNEFIEPFERMIETIATPALVRAVEHGMDAASLWDVVAASGFLDALVPEDRGGAGLSPAQVHPLWLALGRHAVPLPIGETMIARYLLAMAGADLPDGPIFLAEARTGAECVISGGLLARHALVEADGALHLVETASMAPAPTGVNGSLAARVSWSGPTRAAIGAAPAGGLRSLGAILNAARIAGAAARLTGMATAYANERIQFGKPIGRQQALQQTLAVMAEDMVAARIASQLGCAGGLPPSPAAAATAKSVASAAAARITATAHAVFGAIGISEEHDLQLFTRRLHEWRLADGAETFWNRRLGALRLAVEMGSVDFVRAWQDAGQDSSL
ncbi:acyl-CoA dehydrogenase family protein [Sphingomonas colocasiae]|nr:acyl-CoA dehydrogenase family protein [Sphingomonas colocasiae]